MLISHTFGIVNKVMKVSTVKHNEHGVINMEL